VTHFNKIKTEYIIEFWNGF